MTNTPYSIQIAPAAFRQTQALEQQNAKVVIKLIEALAINPRPPGCKKIDGLTGLYKNEIQGFQILYRIEEHEILILTVTA